MRIGWIGNIMVIATTNSGRLKVFRQTESEQINYRIDPGDVYATITLIKVKPGF